MENKIEQLEKYIEVREQEIEELQDRIDKAIEYIEENKYDFCDEYDLRDEDGKKIIDILKGE